MHTSSCVGSDDRQRSTNFAEKPREFQQTPRCLTLIGIGKQMIGARVDHFPLPSACLHILKDTVCQAMAKSE